MAANYAFGSSFSSPPPARYRHAGPVQLWPPHAKHGELAAMTALDLVDPELREVALRMRAMTESYTPLSMKKLTLRRATIAGMAPPWLDDVTVEERQIAGTDGHPDVTIFIVNGKTGESGPAILHLHGGGFNAGSSRAGMCQIQELAQALDCVVVSVEYRLAPETPYPGALEDNFAALRWMHEHAAELGADPARIAILGESAGGGHAALLAIAARDRGQYPICFQALIYPMLDDRTGSSRRVPEHIGAFGWNEETNRFGWQCYLGRAPGGDDVSACAVPARIENLAGLPPAFIGVGALDLFVSENLAFADQLIAAGVPVELMVVPGAIHGFDTLAKESGAARRFTAIKLAALRRAFGLAPA
jgi:acetyl esterase/lipase